MSDSPGHLEPLGTPILQQNLYRCWAVCVFSLVVVLVFWLLYESNLVCFRVADEGSWLDWEMRQSEHGILPLYIRHMLGNHLTLFTARAVSFLAVLCAFFIFGLHVLRVHSFSHEILFYLPVGLLVVWLNPQILACSSRATGGCFSILALSLSLWGLHRLHSQFGVLPALLVVTGVGWLSFSTPYGWSLGNALLIAFLIFTPNNRRLNLISVVIPGMLATHLVFCFEASRQAPLNVVDNYFSFPVLQTKFDFGLSANGRVLPLEFAPNELFMAVSFGVIALALYAIVSKTVNPSSKFHAAAILLFLLIHFFVEYFGKISTIHYYLMAPFVFLILTLPLVMARTARSFVTATLLVALFAVPNLDYHLTNSKQLALQEAAELINLQYSQGVAPIFCGTILYHAVYPWLDADTRRNAKFCYSGNGFQNDKYFSAEFIDSASRVKSDYLILGKASCAVIISSDFGQRISVDIPPNWEKEVFQFYYGDLEFNSLFVSVAKSSAN